MKGRSADQLAEYEGQLVALVDLLTLPMSVRDILREIGGRDGRPTAATVYARLEVLVARGEVVRSRRRKKIPGKSGQRERVYSAADR